MPSRVCFCTICKGEVAWISSDYFESLLLPQLRGENDSKQSDEFQAKGEAVQSSYKVKQHLKLYGLWDSKKSIEGPSTAKKSRNNESDSSTNSDSRQWKVITNHILHHLPEGIERFGPVHGTWMFAYERFNSWLCRRALNRRHPEATILRTYQVMLSVSFEHKYRLYGRCTDRVLIKS